MSCRQANVRGESDASESMELDEASDACAEILVRLFPDFVLKKSQFVAANLF